MIARTFPGGWYAAATPGGEYAVLITGSHLETRTGQVSLPRGQNLLWLDVAWDGRVAGQGHQDDLAWLWAPGGWASFGLAYGPRAVIFDKDGILRVISAAPPVGYRQVADDGTLITAAATYADQARGLWEFTTLGGIVCGQGGAGPSGDDPLIALLPDGTYRLVQAGRCRAIRFTRDGDRLALAWSQEDRTEARLLWLTVAELAALPVYTRPPVGPVPPPVPPVVPPVVPPQPPVPPKPLPLPPTPPVVPLMTFDASLVVMRQAAQKWRALHGKTGQELDEGQAHLWLWRLLREGYSAAKLLASVT